MKNCGKKLLSAALAAAMSCSMISAFANTVSIESVKVLSDASTEVANYTSPSSASISLTPDQLLQVTVKLSPEEGATLSAGDVTFLSFTQDAQSYTNDTVQYVDQKSTTIDNNAGTATITFRPRLDVGEFTAKAGGTDVSTAASFNYTVKAADKQITMTLSKSSDIKEGDSITVTLKDSDEAAVKGATVKATKSDDSTTVVNAVESEAKDGTYTLTFNTAGTYSVSVDKLDGYTPPTAQDVTVIKNEVPETDVDDATTEVEKVVENTKGVKIKEVDLAKTVSVNDNIYTVNYKIEGGSDKAEISSDGKLTLKESNTFGAKVQLTASLGDNVNESMTIYLLPAGKDGSEISFGNIDMIASDNTDAFSDDTKFAAITEHDYTAASAELLNLALGRAGISTVPQGAVDINLDGTVTLAEYRMFKLLISADDTYYVPSAFATARQNATAN